MIDFSPIGFSLPAGLPNKEYALSDGTVTVMLDQSGGFNLIEYHGPRRTDAIRRSAFYSREFWRGPVFFEEPAITFELAAVGKPSPLVFDNLTLAPFGVAGSFVTDKVEVAHAVWICGNAIYVEWRANHQLDISLCVNEGFLQHGNVQATWEEPLFEPSLNALRYQMARNFTAETIEKLNTRHRHEACSLIGASHAATHAVADGRRRLTMRVPADEAGRFIIVFAEDAIEVAWRLSSARHERDAALQRQLTRYRRLAERAPALTLAADRPDNPCSEIIRTSPLFAESTRREKNPLEVGLRASTRGYGLWNGWDGQWGAQVLNAAGADDTARRHLNFVDATRGPNDAIVMVMDHDFGPIHDRNFCTPSPERRLGDGYHINHEMWGVANLHQYYFRTRDRATLERLYPNFRRSLLEIRANTTPQGLCGSCFGGTDYNAQLGRPLFAEKVENCTLTNRLSGSEDMGVLYNGCTLMAELAAHLADQETIDAALYIISALQRHYVAIFYDPTCGWLYDCVWWKENPVNHHHYPRTTNMLALNGYGEQLLLDHLATFATFIRTKMRHPHVGLQSAPREHPPDSPFARLDDNWHQNATHETLKLARLAGDSELLQIQLETITRYFDANKTILENIHHAHPAGRLKPENVFRTNSWWQNMTVKAWWNGIVEAVAGLRYERGQLEHLPGDSGHDTTISNFHWGGHVWRIDVTGRGRWIGQLTVNDRQLSATHQLTADATSSAQHVVIRKTDQPPACPQLLSAGATAAATTADSPGLLELNLHSNGFVPLQLYCPKRPAITLHGTPIDFHWFAGTSQAVLHIARRGDLRITIDCR